MKANILAALGALVLLIGALFSQALYARIFGGHIAIYRDWTPQEIARHKPALACTQEEFFPGWSDLEKRSYENGVPEIEIMDQKRGMAPPNCQCLCPPDAHQGKLTWSKDGYEATCSCLVRS